MEHKNHRMLEKALDILEFAANSPEGAGLAEISEKLGIPKSSAHILLGTLADRGYLQKKSDGVFSVGIKAFEVGSKFVDGNDFYFYSRQVLEELVNAVDETAHAAVLDGTDVVYLNKFECRHAVRMVSSVGKRIPAHATAIGKALLALKTDEEIRALYQGRVMEKLTENTITDLEELLAQLDEVRRTGFAIEKEESTFGVECIAVATSNRAGSVSMGISVSIPLLRQTEPGMDAFRRPLCEAKEKMRIVL